MDFGHSHVDARHSSFSQVEGDFNWHQTVNNPTINYTIQISGCSSCTSRLPYNPSLSISRVPEAVFQRDFPVIIHSSVTIPVVDAAVDLIVQITDKLIDPRDVSINHRDLRGQLKSLQQTLIMVGLAVNEYQNGPLGQCLINAISPEMARCCIGLQELLLRVNDTCMGLKFTKIGSFWLPIWQERWKGDELLALRRCLYRGSKLFEGLLMALYSCVFTPFRVL
jgi:hypothetical protein